MQKQPKKFKVSKIGGYVVTDTETQENITVLIEDKRIADKLCEVFNGSA